MFDNTYARTTIYNLPVFPNVNNITILGDNKRTLAEVAQDFVFSFYKILDNVVVFNPNKLFKNLYKTKNIFVTDNADFINTYITYLIKHKAKENVYLVLCSADKLKQDLLLKLLKQQNKFVNVVLLYNKPAKELIDIAFYSDEVVFFKTNNAKFIDLANKLCLECNCYLPVLLKRMQGFVVCNTNTRKCNYIKANLGLKTHLLFYEITEILEILFKKSYKRFYH